MPYVRHGSWGCRGRARRGQCHISAGEREEYDRVVADLHTQHDEAAGQAAWAAGQAMSLEQAIAYALEERQDA